MNESRESKTRDTIRRPIYRAPKPINRFKSELQISKKDSSFTVADFLADVQLIQAKHQPHILGVGLAFTKFQQFQDQIDIEKKAKKAKGCKSDIELSLRAAQEIQERKKRQVAVYERLEQELTRFELEEEEDEEELGKM